MKLSLIVTVLNEEENIDKFFKSLFSQTFLPDKVVVVDGGSNDRTVEKIQEQIDKNKKKITIKLLTRIGNRSTGRNFAIKNSSSEIILATDFGCTLDKNWIENISAPFEDSKIDIVAGFYKPVSSNVFKKCLSTYTCVMSDRLNEDDFLPSSRSIAFRKKVWQKNKYPQWLDTCEDLVFAKKLKDKGARFMFVKNAIVYWEQKNNLKEAFFQFLAYAKGDGRALFIRPQVPLIYLRYFLGIYFLFLCALEKSLLGLSIILILIPLYLIWAIKKNYKYVRNKKAFIFLPLLQITSDIAVLSGTSFGIARRFSYKKLIPCLTNNKFLVFTLFAYVLLMLLTIDYGIPNKFHPFPYHMDEWHQLQAVRSTFAYGTPNVEGSANGTMLHFIISGFYLIPFSLLGLINPFELKIDDLIARQNIFILLRINTIIWGILSIVLIYKIADLLKLSKRLTVFLFTFNPLWLMLSGYFKYDIALMFFILLSLFSMFRFSKNPSNSNYVIAAIPIGMALAVKISVLPLIPMYFFSYFWFQNERIKNLKYMILGLASVFITAVIFGFPDTLFGTGNIYKYLYENLVIFPSASENIKGGGNLIFYVFLKHYSVIFGIGLLVLFILSLAFLIALIFKSGFKKFLQEYKLEMFAIFSFLLFLSSLVTLKAYAGGNRALVLLPFFVLIISLAYKETQKNKSLRFVFGILIGFVILVQIYFSFAWLELKRDKSIQEESSEWISRYITVDSVIGLESIPIYQNIPDKLQKEFYFKEYGVGSKNKFNYEIVDARTEKLPEVIVITNHKVEGEIQYNSPKKDLTRRLNKENYKIVKEFKKDTGMLFLDDKDYTVAGLDSSPLTITVYKK